MKKWMKIWKLFKLLKILIFYWKEFGKQLKKKKNSKKKKRIFRNVIRYVRSCLLGNILTRKKILKAGYGNKEGKRVLKAGYGGYGNKKSFNATSYFNKIWNTDVLSEWT